MSYYCNAYKISKLYCTVISIASCSVGDNFATLEGSKISLTCGNILLALSKLPFCIFAKRMDNFDK